MYVIFYKQALVNNENPEAAGRVIFVVLECFTNEREELKLRVGRPSASYCYLVFVIPSELDFHIGNANWPMKCEAKMAAHGG